MTIMQETRAGRSTIPLPRAAPIPRRAGTRKRFAVLAGAAGLLGLGVGLGVGMVASDAELDALREDVAAMEVDVGRARSGLVLSNADYSMAREHQSLAPATADAGYSQTREHLSLQPVASYALQREHQSLAP